MAPPASTLLSGPSNSFLSSTLRPSACSPCSSCNLLLPRNSIFSSGLHTSGNSLFFRGKELLVRKRGSVLEYRPRQPGHFAVHAFFGLGLPELVVIAGVTTLIFGPTKLPEIGKSLGKTVKGFQKAAKEFEEEVKKASDSMAADATESGASSVTSDVEN